MEPKIKTRKPRYITPLSVVWAAMLLPVAGLLLMSIVDQHDGYGAYGVFMSLCFMVLPLLLNPLVNRLAYNNSTSWWLAQIFLSAGFIAICGHFFFG